MYVSRLLKSACRFPGRQLSVSNTTFYFLIVSALPLIIKQICDLLRQRGLKAFATVCLADAFLVTGIRVVECEKGITVFMPQQGTYHHRDQDLKGRINKTLPLFSGKDAILAK